MFMTITSFQFLVFVSAGLVIYYLLPKSWQWVVLLGMSLIFYGWAARSYTILYPVVSTLTAYVCTMWIDRIRKSGHGDSRLIKVLAAAALAVNIILWFIFKGYGFWMPVIGDADVELAAALGMGYYTLQIMGYILDCTWEVVEPQKNLLKLFLFVCFFPQLTTGPISQYSQLETLFQKHEFRYLNVAHGAQRILWGFFKKLVLAERVGMIVSGITADLSLYNGFYSWIVILLYPVQMYADFSGCMDIVLGMSESLGIVLPENFRTPFFAKSVAEYWRRWHITLGVWMKDYVFYPLLRSRFFTNLNKSWKKKFGKKKGKQYATFAAMFLLWFTVGVWHGGDWKYVIGSGLLHWFYIVMEELLEEPCAGAMKKLHINAEGRAVAAVRVARTFLLVCIGDLFFRAESVTAAFAMLKSAVTVWNPEILWNGALFGLGLDVIETGIAIFSLLLLLTVSILQQKGSVRERIAGKILPVRWLIWYALLFYVIFFGCYGPEYSAAEFIYQGF